MKKAEFDYLGAKDQFELALSLATKCGHHGLIELAQFKLSLLQAQSSTLQRLMTSTPKDFAQLQFQEVLSYLEGAQEQARDSTK